MARRPRLLIPSLCHHVILRGNGGQNIFYDESDHARFCLFLQQAAELHQFEIYAFCFMTNHIHLLVEPHTKDFSSGVHAFAFRYAQYFNRKYDRKGHLFQGRFKSIIVQGGVYLCRLIRYIHRNPVRAGLVERPIEYKWSSHRVCVGKSDYVWLNKNWIYQLFSPEQEALSIESIRAKIDTFINTEDAEVRSHLQEIRQSMRLGAYGSEVFRAMHGIFDAGKRVGQISSQLNRLIDCTCEYALITADELQGEGRQVDSSNARSLLALVARSKGIASVSEIARALFRDRTSISRLIRRAETRPMLLKQAEEIYQLFIEK